MAAGVKAFSSIYLRAVPNQPFQVQISAEDASGHVVPSFTGSVTIQIASGTSNATLDGTLTVSAVNGVAAFSSLTLDEAGTFTLRATAAGLTSATTAAFVVVTDIVVTLTSTQNAATGVRPDSNQFMTTNSSLDFAPSTPNDLMVVVQDAGPLTVTSIGEPDPNAPLRWEIDRNPDDSVAAGLPALSATAGTQITVTPNVPGSFRLICYLDSDGNQTFEPGEQLTVLRLAIVRVTLQPNSDSITTTAVLTGGSRGISITTPMAIQADVLLEGGGADEMLGVDQIVLGDIGNLLGDSFTVDYPGGSTDAREGIEREDPDGMLDPAPGFPAPMIDTSRVAEGTEPTGGDTAFRFLSRDAIVGPGSAGGGQIRRVTVQDNPAYRWDYNHPMTMNPWATTVGSNAFREFVVVFSQTFTRNYVALASADWTVTVDGANVGGIWNDAGSTVTIQGGGASSAPLTVAGFPMTGDAAGVQTLGFSFVREYTMVAELVPPPMPPGGRGATRRVPQPLFESGSLAEETSPILAKLRLAYPPSGVTSPAKPTPASVQSSQAVTVTDQFFACIDEQESWSMLGAQTKFISQRPSSPNQRDGNLDVTTPFDLFVDVQHFGMV